jgi:LPS sulfotransferase NodH
MSTPKKRIFLVGCPRSGTTLLQSLLAAHPQIASFPESHFFIHLLAKREPYQKKIGLAAPQAKLRFKQFLDEIGQQKMQHYLPIYALFATQYANAFIKVLDVLTQEQNKSVWIEKTPDHVRHIYDIEKLVKETQFIHIVRNGADVVASLYEVTHKYPQVWHGAWDIDRCIRRWTESLQFTKKHLHKPNHILVSYEQLVEEPKSVLQKLGNFLDIDLDYEILQQQRGSIAQKIVLENEPWKASISEPLSNANQKKFSQLFDENERNYIVEKVSNLLLYTELKALSAKA